MISILEALGYNVSGGKLSSARRLTSPHKQTSTSMPRSPTTSSRTKCPFYASKGVKGWVRRHLSNRTKDCHSCPYVEKAIEEALKNDPGTYRSVVAEEFGDRFKISDTVDPADLEDNKRVARTILRSFPDIEVRIRSNITHQ